ncbi:MAG: hypothetical protein JWO57_78 [Pseudonocardiales bacterium]|nr:hypothetical protein [Pseudonocardiales bacterium]
MSSSVRSAEAVSPLVLERRALRRAVAVVGLAGIGLIHLLYLPGELTGEQYLGTLFLVLAFVIAEMLVRTDDRRAWRAAGLLAGAMMLDYATSRLVDLPGEHGEDIGRWLQPLSLAGVLVEGVVALLVVARLTDWPQEHRAVSQPADSTLAGVAAVHRWSEYRQARAQWRRLPWAIRHDVLAHALHGAPHPDPYTAAITYRWATAQLTVRPAAHIAEVGGGTLVAGTLAGLLPLGFSASGRVGFAAIATLIGLFLGLIAVWLNRGQTREVAQANHPEDLQPRSSTNSPTA